MLIWRRLRLDAKLSKAEEMVAEANETAGSGVKSDADTTLAEAQQIAIEAKKSARPSPLPRRSRRPLTLLPKHMPSSLPLRKLRRKESKTNLRWRRSGEEKLTGEARRS